MGRIVTIEGIRPKDKFQLRIFLPSELATSLGLVSTEMVTGGMTMRRSCIQPATKEEEVVGFEASGLR